MSWYNPWGEIAALRRQLLTTESTVRAASDKITRLELDNAALNAKVRERDRVIASLQSSLQRANDIISKGHFHDPATGKLGKKGVLPEALRA